MNFDVKLPFWYSCVKSNILNLLFNEKVRLEFEAYMLIVRVKGFDWVVIIMVGEIFIINDEQ